jgi:hypothetical protein
MIIIALYGRVENMTPVENRFRAGKREKRKKKKGWRTYQGRIKTKERG